MNRNPMPSNIAFNSPLVMRSITVAAIGLWKHYLASERCGLSCIMSHVISLSLRLLVNSQNVCKPTFCIQICVDLLCLQICTDLLWHHAWHTKYFSNVKICNDSSPSGGFAPRPSPAALSLRALSLDPVGGFLCVCTPDPLQKWSPLGPKNRRRTWQKQELFAVYVDDWLANNCSCVSAMQPCGIMFTV